MKDKHKEEISKFYTILLPLLKPNEREVFVSECLANPQRNPAKALLSKIGVNPDAVDYIEDLRFIAESVIDGSLDIHVDFAMQCNDMSREWLLGEVVKARDALRPLNEEARQHEAEVAYLPILTEAHACFPDHGLV